MASGPTCTGGFAEISAVRAASPLLTFRCCPSSCDVKGASSTHGALMRSGMQVAPASRRANAWNSHVERTATATGLSGKEGLFSIAAASYAQFKLAGADGLELPVEALFGEAGGGGGGGGPALRAASEMSAALADAARPDANWEHAAGAWDDGDAGLGAARTRGEGNGVRAGRGRAPGEAADGGGAPAEEAPGGVGKKSAANIRDEIDTW